MNELKIRSDAHAEHRGLQSFHKLEVEASMPSEDNRSGAGPGRRPQSLLPAGVERILAVRQTRRASVQMRKVLLPARFLPVLPMVIGRSIDSVLDALKWPIGVVAVLMLGPLCYAGLRFAMRLWQHPWGLIWFVAGILLYALAWRPLARRRLKTDWMLNLEHELTHALFAVLTGHRVRSFQVTRKGGKVEVIGGSNWLIAIAPYFFPTAPLILLFFAMLMPLGSLLPWTGLFLGFALAYHVRSTWTETQAAKTDFDQAGRWFSLIFLPSANLCAIGLIASFAVGGWADMKLFLSDAAVVIHWLVAVVQSWFPASLDEGLELHPEQMEEAIVGIFCSPLDSAERN